MGGGPDKEHLVIALMDPEPKHITALLKQQFPYFDITYFQVSREGSGPKTKDLGSQIPDGESLSLCLRLRYQANLVAPSISVTV